MAACGQATASQGVGASPTPTVVPTPTSIPTPTVPPASSLTWHPHSLPASPSGAQAATLAISQHDGNTAYVCAADPPNARAQVWVTHDQANHWARVTDLQISQDILTGGGSLPAGSVVACMLEVDALRPATLVARVTVSYPDQNCRGGCASISTFASTDGGQSWAPLAGPLPELTELATYRQVTYAIFHRIPHGFDAPNGVLAISRDGPRSWSKIAPPTKDAIYQFWLNPFDGGLLALTATGEVGSGRLWRTLDDGRTWTQLAPPPFPFDPSYIVAQQPYTRQDWAICGANPVLGTMPSPPNQPNEIACTRDSGATWTRRALDIPAGYTIFPILGIADDGSLLLNVTKSNTPVISPVLYRVTPGASTITSLGAAPQANIASYAAGQGSGVLWMGPIDGATDSDPQGRIFTAVYP